MNKFFLFLAFMACSLAADAQMAHWIIPPHYDGLTMSETADLLVADSAQTRILWTFDGKRVAAVEGEIQPFSDGMAVVKRPDGDDILELLTADGKHVNLRGCRVAGKPAVFSSERLLVKKGEFYRFADPKGRLTAEKFLKAYPFSNGFAVCNTYVNFEKPKETYTFMTDTTGTHVEFSFNGKVFKPEDVNFVSSVNDEQMAIVVIRKRVYVFDAEERMLTPLMVNAEETNLKYQAKIEGKEEELLQQNPDGTGSITARCSKEDVVNITFDAFLRPVSIVRNGEAVTYNVHEPERRVLESPLEGIAEGSFSGIAWDGVTVLPPQFSEVVCCFGDRAVVRVGDKYGLLRVYKDERFKIRMNKGDDIAFRHQKFETTLRVDFPTFVPSLTTTVEMENSEGCELDKTSRIAVDTESGNYVQYNCVLNIPSSLPDELTEVNYPLHIVYDGIRSGVIPFKVRAWHYKYFVVDLDDSQTSLSDGNLSFVFYINAERFDQDAIYPCDVNVLTQNEETVLEKLSETRFKCSLSNLQEGLTPFDVQVVEQGCPPALFPFEVEYHAAKPKTRTTPAQPQVLIVRKRVSEPGIDTLDIDAENGSDGNDSCEPQR